MHIKISETLMTYMERPVVGCPWDIFFKCNGGTQRPNVSKYATLQGTLKRSFSAEKVPLCEPTLRIWNPSKKGTESRLVSELVLISIFADDQGAFGRKHKSETWWISTKR